MKNWKYTIETAKELREIINNSDIKLQYHVGTMIEIPRAALLSDEIASIK